MIINNEIVKDPCNYAAIYARISSVKDNNSIAAQIEKGKECLANNNLLLYAVYTDHISARNTSPKDRPGCGKLIQDAKDGSFKTVIVYRHDRLVRNLNDWIETKNLFKKLGMRIIFTDKDEFSSDNSQTGEFLENLMVMVAELEPDNISERASLGRQVRRKQGIYPLTGKVPMGYIREEVSEESVDKTVKFKARLVPDPLKSTVINFVFEHCKWLIERKTFTVPTLKRTVIELLDGTLQLLSLIDYDLRSDKPQSDYSSLFKSFKSLHIDPNKIKFIENIEYQYSETKKNDDMKSKLLELRTYLSEGTNIDNMLKNSVYGGFMLIDAKEQNSGLSFVNDKPKLNLHLFRETKNVDNIVEKDTFEVVYCHVHALSLQMPKEPDYLLKGKLKCGTCGRNMVLHEHLLSCPAKNRKDSCSSYVKTNLIESVLGVIIDDAFKKTPQGFIKFYKAVEKKLEYLDSEIATLRQSKMNLLKNYLQSKDKESIALVNDKNDRINELTDKISEYRKELSIINSFYIIVDSYINKKPLSKPSEDLITNIKNNIVSAILFREDYFKTIFNEIIKEIRVSIVESDRKKKCEIGVNYEFSYRRNSDIFKSIH